MTSTKEWRKMFIDCEKSLFITEILRISTIDSSKKFNKSKKAVAVYCEE